jgi:hypothetical protein
MTRLTHVIWDIGPLEFERFTGGSFYLGGSGGCHITELVGETTETGSEGGWRDFTKVDGNYTPCSLDSGLDKETAGCETAERVGEDPEGDPAGSVAECHYDPGC